MTWSTESSGRRGGDEGSELPPNARPVEARSPDVVGAVPNPSVAAFCCHPVGRFAQLTTQSQMTRLLRRTQLGWLLSSCPQCAQSIGRGPVVTVRPGRHRHRWLPTYSVLGHAVTVATPSPHASDHGGVSSTLPTAFRGGTIMTMDAAHPRADIVVFEGGRISAVGDSELLARYPTATIVDLGDRTVTPGFIDAHSHLCIAALHPCWADLTGVTDSDGLAAALRRQAHDDPDSEWVRAVGWSDLEQGWTPNRDDLDGLGIDRPVIVVHYSLHQCVVSSAGLDALGISDRSTDPPDGIIGRSASGALTGLLVERAFSEAHARSMAPYREQDRWEEHIAAAARRLLADGVTCVHDAACPPSAERAYRSLARQRRLPLSVLAMPHPEALLSPLDETRLDGPASGEGDEWLRVGPIKLFADGGVLPAIQGTVHGHEVSLGMTFPGLADQVDRIVGRGFDVAVHAIGNRGLDVTLDAFESASRRHADQDRRFRIEHATLLGRQQAARMKKVGAVAVVQPGFLHHMGGAVDGFELDEATWMPFADSSTPESPWRPRRTAPVPFRSPC